jgi:hypothetical protein
MEHLLDELTKNIKTIIASGKDNLDMLNENKPSIEKEIKQTRLAINGYLDKLERELLVKLQEAGDSAKGQILDLAATLVNSSNKCSISWTELEFFTLSTTSSSGTISLQLL